MNKKVLILVGGFTLLLVGLGIFFASSSQKPKITGLDDFAKCLTAKKAVMYGASWCPHCQAVKAEFGASFQYVTYVECPVETQKCLDNNINGYPTWIFGDSQRLEGEQTLQKISEVSACPLPPVKK